MLERLEDRTTPSSISGLSPSVRPHSGGGTVLQINGSGFTGVTAVSFGGVAATSFAFVNEPGRGVRAYGAGPGRRHGGRHRDHDRRHVRLVNDNQFTYVPIATTTTLTSSANPSTFGQSITLTATVSNGGPGTRPGQVEFLDGDNVIGTATCPNGQATLVTSALTPAAITSAPPIRAMPATPSAPRTRST